MLARRSLFLSFTLLLGLVGSSVTIGVGTPGSKVGTANAQSSAPTFGRPTMSSIQGAGFEPGIRVDPAGRIYTHSPNSLSSGTSWIWISHDGGKTYKWVPAASPKEGKLPTCAGGGDSELATDTANNIYFNELTLANFSVSRSEDQGRTFLPPGGSCFGVINTVVDRQWYATDGDPTAGGNIYLVHNKFAQDNPVCPGVIDPFNNLLVMARSPVSGAGESAGIVFAPEKEISAPCNEGIMGNVEISPTTKKIYVIHDNAAFNAILIGRCQNVPFTTDPTGLSCVDLPVASFPGFRTGGNFPTLAIDSAGHLMTVWEMAPVEADGDIIGDTLLFWSSSTDEGNTWTPPVQIPTPNLRNNILAWVAAGDAGRANIAWYGTATPQNPADPTCGHAAARGGPDSAEGNWSLYFSQTLNGTSANPTFSAPIQVGGRHVSHSTAFTIIGGQCGDRQELGDFFQLRTGNQGEAVIAYTESNNRVSFSTHLMTVRQNGGPGLFLANPTISGAPAPTNAVADPSGDGRFEALGLTGPNQPNLDILSSRVSLLTNPERYRIRMVVSDLTSLAPSATSQNPDRNLVWSTQWYKPSATSVDGGKNFHVFMESFNGGAPTFWVGENATTLQGGGVYMTYPGTSAVTGSYTPTAPGTITIDVPVGLVSVPNPIAGNRLFSVTASTMTLDASANSVPPIGGIGGLKFNLIDVAPAYDFREQSIRTSIP
jgi:hypothetical protein